VRTYHEGFPQTLKIGTFYLAGIRNFLFGSDSNDIGSGLADGAYIGNGGAPWPLTLGGTTVAICYSETAGAQATCVSPQLLYVSPQRINVLMPNLWEPLPPEAYGLAETVYVVRGTGASQIQSNGVLFALLLESPDILLAGYDCPINADYICPPQQHKKTIHPTFAEAP
jgi:hypothetical protein